MAITTYMRCVECGKATPCLLSSKSTHVVNAFTCPLESRPALWQEMTEDNGLEYFAMKLRVAHEILTEGIDALNYDDDGEPLDAFTRLYDEVEDLKDIDDIRLAFYAYRKAYREIFDFDGLDHHVEKDFHKVQKYYTKEDAIIKASRGGFVMGVIYALKMLDEERQRLEKEKELHK